MEEVCKFILYASLMGDGDTKSCRQRKTMNYTSIFTKDDDQLGTEASSFYFSH